MIKDTLKLKRLNLTHEKHSKGNRQNKPVSPNNMTEEIIIDITSSAIEKMLRDINIHAHVRGGLILRPAKITIPLRRNKLLVGDKVILMGISKEVARSFEKIKEK